MQMQRARRRRERTSEIMFSKSFKSNWGTLEEIPEISVDRFGSTHPNTSGVDWKTSRAFFMTHFDDEINKDVLCLQFLDILANPEYNCRLYMHHLTLMYLKYWAEVRMVDDSEAVLSRLETLQESRRLILLDTNKPIRLNFQVRDLGKDDFSVRVTALSSGSDFGNIMILFEKLGRDECVILYTGACRLMQKDLQDNPSIHTEDGCVKKIHTLYLDTTYAAPYVHELPLRRHVTAGLQDMLQFISNQSPTMQFDFYTSLRFQHLTFFHNLAEWIPTESGLHVPSPLAKFYKEIPAFSSRVHDQFEINDRVHYDFGYYLSGAVVEGVDMTETLIVDLGCAFPHKEEVPIMHCIGKNDPENWCLEEKCVYLVDRNEMMRVIYPSNLSRNEMGRMVKYLKPERVLPLYTDPDENKVELANLIITSVEVGDNPDEPAEFSSHYYDFTFLTDPKSTRSTRKIPEYTHEVKGSTDFFALLGFSNNRRINFEELLEYDLVLD